MSPNTDMAVSTGPDMRQACRQETDDLSLQKYGCELLCLSVAYVLFAAFAKAGSQGGCLDGGTGAGHFGVGTVLAPTKLPPPLLLLLVLDAEPDGGTMKGRQVLWSFSP